MDATSEREVGALLRVRVQPRASRNALRVEPSGVVRVSLTAPPVEGEANAALCAFMAKVLGLTKRNISLASGGKSREKTLKITGLAPKEVAARLRRT